ncbi:methyltransferase domain-containing protein [Actinocorallia sp. API 0066]|uniref:protein-L-isoaspartate O-methyltransferase family protein n=1 Tax=Actinocorallia sp. API 0066 TaxID=2896846 RepID=UPI001E423558|nr:methyltransferase domain-containing protein [Actinocorallia sp. API 0066]MCD0448257.1 methyltransferase domain-containing protein [Actinocorallia sp. API 0066]
MSFTYGETELPVDRRLFVPETIYVWDDGWLVPLRRAEQPEEWERHVAADLAVITATDEKERLLPGATYPPGKGFIPMSSSSEPAMMARMIAELELAPGMRVLEIGTGTGYNAACLAAYGAEVVTVEIDGTIAERARKALHDAGFPEVVVLTGDGEQGAEEHAPFDRVVATAAAHTIPYPWVRQTRDGGRIVAPYTGAGRRFGLLVLDVHDGEAVGRFTGFAGFMPLRGQRLRPAVVNYIEDWPEVEVRVTSEGQTPTLPEEDQR